ncbi:MAG TPA: phage holin family protein [Patescibacteria group bacterium]|nr:phage holin family protein [Patescibacteria group bacterium]
MTKFIRQSLLNSFTLYLAGLVYPGIIVPQALVDLLLAGLIFTLVNRLIKPVIKLFLLPLNLITLGLFSWIVNVIVLFIMTKLVSSLSVTGFTLAATSLSGFATPALIISLPVSYILASIFLSLIFALLNRFMVKE